MAEHERPASARHTSLRAFLIVVGAVVAVASLYFGAIVLAGDGFRSGTTVAGVDISGLSNPEAIDKLN